MDESSSEVLGYSGLNERVNFATGKFSNYKITQFLLILANYKLNSG